MATYKYIVWRNDMGEKDGKTFANVIFLVGYNQRTIADYQQMAEELRKTFPNAKNEDLVCSFVSESHYCKGFSLLGFNAYIEFKEYDGWRDMKKLDFCFG